VISGPGKSFVTVDRSRRLVWLRHGLAAASFILYAIAALLLDQAHTNKNWNIEANVGFPAAISATVYGAPVGTVVDQVDRIFQQIFSPDRPITVQDAFFLTAGGQISGGQPIEHFDGTGPGFPLFATVAMLLLGPHLSSVVSAFLILMGLSSLIYGIRFEDDRLLLVPVQYLALTTMMLAPMVTEYAWSFQTSIGGQRYFMLAGILPGAHLFFELCDRDAHGWRKPGWPALLLGLQMALLVLVMFVRNSIAYVLAPSLLALAWRWWSRRRKRQGRVDLYWKAVAAGVAATIVVGAVAAAMPSYIESGRVFGVVWHRAFISLGLHPEFPFGDMAPKTDCRKYIPEGLVGGLADRNGHCVWLADPANKNRELSDIGPETLGPQYERVLRQATIQTIVAYPRQALELYFYYKPLLILTTLRESLRLSITAANARATWFVSLQWLAFLAFVFLTATSGRETVTPRIAALPAAFFLLSMAPGIVAWSHLSTGVDTVFLMYCLIGLAVAFVAERVVRLARSRPLFVRQAGIDC